MSRADKVGEHKGKDMSIILVLKGKNKGRKTKIILIIESLCGNWISIHPAPEALSTVGMSREQQSCPSLRLASLLSQRVRQVRAS